MQHLKEEPNLHRTVRLHQGEAMLLQGSQEQQRGRKLKGRKPQSRKEIQEPNGEDEFLLLSGEPEASIEAAELILLKICHRMRITSS